MSRAHCVPIEAAAPADARQPGGCAGLRFRAERRLRAEAESMLDHLLRHPELFRRAEHIPCRPPQYVCRLRLRLELDAVLRRS